jgi:DNA-binding LacI/PurR family transcriptional regulator
VVRTLRQAGRRVPADVAVVGFEDAAVAVQVDPPLTTVHQPVEAMGRTMARTLSALINGQDVQDEVLATHLVVRESG